MKTASDSKMIAAANLFARLTLVLAIAGTTGLNFFVFQVSDMRTFLPFTTITSLVTIILCKKTRNVLLDFFGKAEFLLFSLFLLFSTLVLYSAPTTYSKMIVTIILLTLNFIVFSVLSKAGGSSNYFAEVIIGDAILASLFVCGISAFILIGGQNGLSLLSKLIEPSNYRYLQYDLGRGRVYPLFPPTYLVGITLVASLIELRRSKRILSLVPLVLGIIAMFASNYRILIIAGIVLVILSIKTAANLGYKKIVFPILLAGILPGILLSTNIIKRISLVDIKDADSISGRISIVGSYVSQSIINNFEASGFGNSTEEADRILENKTGQFPTNQNPHNIYLHLLVEGGIPVALTYFLIVLYMGVLDTKIIRNQNTGQLERVMAITCIVFFVTSAFERHQLNVFVFIFSIQGLLYGNSEIIRNSGTLNIPNTGRLVAP